jgi:hypothetical protein
MRTSLPPHSVRRRLAGDAAKSIIRASVNSARGAGIIFATDARCAIVQVRKAAAGGIAVRRSYTILTNGGSFNTAYAVEEGLTHKGYTEKEKGDVPFLQYILLFYLTWGLT